MTDENTSIKKIKKEVEKFVIERNCSRYHTPKNIAESISIESAELLEEFQWKSGEEIEKLLENTENQKSIEKELADVMIYCLSLADGLNIDVTKAILDKLESAKQKYPKEEFNGDWNKQK